MVYLLTNRVRYHLSAADGDALLRLNLMRNSGETSHQTSDAVLELSVLGGVDERIDAAVDVHQDGTEVEKPAGVTDVVADEAEKVDDLV